MIRTFILLLLYAEVKLVIGQYSNNFAYEWKTPTNCAENEVYNPILFKCKPCGLDQIANHQRSNCVCKSTFKTVLEKQQNQCTQCAQGKITKFL